MSGATKPTDFFPASACLFGIVPLKDLLPDLTPATFPRFVAEQVSRVTSLQQDLARMVALAEQLPTRISGLAGGAEAQAQAVVTAVQAVGPRAAAVLQALAAYTPGGPLPGTLGQLGGTLGALRTALDAADVLPRAVRVEAVERGQAAPGERRRRHRAGGDAGRDGRRCRIPETVKARMHWSTTFKAWPNAADAIFLPRQPGKSAADARTTLDLSVEVQARDATGGPAERGHHVLALAVLSGADRRHGPVHRPGHRHDRVRDGDGQEDRRQRGLRQHRGALRRSAELREHRCGRSSRWTGFSDPPYLDVTPGGIKAGFDLALPDIPLGVLNLTQVSLGAEVNVPFIGESLDFRFSFCTRERPFHLTVWVFGGGGFFAITVTPKECKILEAAFEFGACASIDFGVASGSVEVMAGIYFRLQTGKSELTGYFRLRGEVDVLGLISASLELYLELSYEIDTKTARGRAELTIEVEVLMFSTSVTMECEKKFQGSDQDPTFAEVMGPAAGAAVDTSPWDDYCAAFAAA